MMGYPKGVRVERYALLLLFLAFIAAGAVMGQATYDTLFQQKSLDDLLDQAPVESENELVPALFVFGDSVLDAGSNHLFPSLLTANHEPYGSTYFGRPTGRYTDGRTYADFFADKLGLAFPEPYLKRKGKWSVIKGVNYASAGSGIFAATNRESKVIPFPDQILQFQQTKLQIDQILKSNTAAKELYAKSIFLVNIGGNDLVTYLFNPTKPVDAFMQSLMDVLEESIKTLYEIGARKFMLLGIGPVGCVPAVLVSSGIEDGKCLESANDLTKKFNGALENLVMKTLPKRFVDIKAIIGKPYSTLQSFVEGEHGFTAGVNACCGAGMYNAEVQCGRTMNLITNPPSSVCDNVDEYLFWDYFHPTDRAYGIVAGEFWDGGLESVAPVNLKTLVWL